MTTARAKIKTPPELTAVRVEARRRGLKVVFTNGCFDLLHVGHVRYLEAARALGDLLIVGVNDDASARRLGKGEGRPYNPAAARAEVVAALAAVDYVTVFGDDTPLELIKTLLPDVLVKGGDWPVAGIVGAAEVRAAGGEVHSLPFVKGYSTSALVAKIKGEARGGEK